ncbi:MAG TPA: hypothetical protein VE736_10675 [Gaiellaceae bacterium]|jgi:hypothetical protein|nr:hypothetical protein [Gaiellaceae bacterium]
MLRKLLSLGAVALVAVAFGVGTAAAKPGNADPSKATPSGNAYGQDGFSDGRLGS